MSLLHLLDVFFLLFHSLWILLVILGWIWSRTRRLCLAALALTTISWFGFGYWWGWGYCVCTDWHWQVRRSLGDLNLPHNYIGFLIREGTGLEVPDPVLEPVILGAFLASAAGGVGLSLRDRSLKAGTEDSDKKVAPGRQQESRRSRVPHRRAGGPH